MEPERRDRGGGDPTGPPARSNSPEEQRRVVRAAALRPINLAMLFIGGGVFATTLAWWIIPLTLATYTLLVVLAARDPFFSNRVLGLDGAASPGSDTRTTSDIPPERRARWLRRGETRSTVEEALSTYRKLVASIEGSGEVARSVLGDAVPKLHEAAERLVQVAHDREKAAEALQEIKDPGTGVASDEDRTAIAMDLEDKIRQADEEISGTYDRLMTLRARMVGASLNSQSENRAAASELNRSLDELNFRLEALGEISSHPREDNNT